jgi:hypothetical protein
LRELAATGVFGSRFRAIAKRTFERKTSNVPLRLRRFRKSVAWPDARMRECAHPSPPANRLAPLNSIAVIQGAVVRARAALALERFDASMLDSAPMNRILPCLWAAT